MKKIALLILIALSIFNNSYSQPLAKADTLFQKEKFAEAFTEYINILKIRRYSKNNQIIFKAAESAYRANMLNEAIPLLEKCSAKEPKSFYILGEIAFERYHFADAETYYANFLAANSDSNSTDFATITSRLKQAKLGAELIKRVENVKIIDSVVVSKQNFISYFNLSKDVGQLSQKRVWNGSENVDLIGFITERKDREIFSNLEDGKINIFSKYRLIDSWDNPQPLNGVNSSQNNENYPFLLLDGVTLYFARDGEETLGGYDIFITAFNTSTNKYLKPENIGMPFNSPYNDYMLALDESKNIGWFVSDRFLPDDKVSIYRFVPNREKIVVRSENLDSIVDRAKILNVKKGIRTYKKYNPNIQKNSNQNIQNIYINDHIKYTNATQFVSNEARNLYHEIEKRKSELIHDQWKLNDIRKSIEISENNRVKEDALYLEKWIKNEKIEIKLMEKKMRNIEIKTLID